jgi:hypothetical protein
MAMRVLSLDFDYTYDPADFATFDSATSCLDYDAVIWNPAHTLHNYSQDNPYRGLPRLADDSSARAIGDIARRKREFTEMIELGRTVIVFVCPPQLFYYDTGQRQYSGTGRNRQTTHMVREADFWHALPYQVQLHAASGKNLTCSAGAELMELWARHKQFFAYQAYLGKAVGHASWHIAGTKKVAGCVERTREGGLLLLLPMVEFPLVDVANDDDDETPAAAPFFEDLLNTLETLRDPDASEVLPSWSSDYLLPGESTKRAALVTRTKELQNAEAAVTDAADELRKAQGSKILVSGTGRRLELAVRAVLEHLGGSVTEPPPGRDDWIVSFPEGEGVVEVKGVQGSAAEKHAAQLEKWVAHRVEETGNVPKGILVVNGWRLLPLSERVERIFPDQMLAYSTTRQHCLVTGLQLLGMMLVADTPDKKKACRELLLKTAGRLEGYDDWSAFLERELPAATGAGEPTTQAE